MKNSQIRILHRIFSVGFVGLLAVACTSGGRLTIKMLPPTPQSRGVIPATVKTPPPLSISLGTGFTCATVSGKAYCWGLNDSGQLGANFPVNPRSFSTTPSAVTGLGSEEMHGVYAGLDHTCAKTSKRKVYCWGNGSKSQLGDDPRVPNPAARAYFQSSAVEAVTLDQPFDSMTLGHDTTCGLTRLKLACIGDGAFGILGNGSRGIQTHPTYPIGMNSGVTSASVGVNHGCAVKSKKVYCWGRNNHGQLGNGTRHNSELPVEVVGLPSHVKEVKVGDGFSCALLQDQSVYCWGRNDFGQLGNGTYVPSANPVRVARLGQTALVLNTGATHACVSTVKNRLKCWGSNLSGQIGYPTGVGTYPFPARVRDLPPVVAFGLGDQHTCAWASDKNLYCWGSNQFGQLGDGNANSKYTPTLVPQFWAD